MLLCWRGSRSRVSKAAPDLSEPLHPAPPGRGSRAVFRVHSPDIPPVYPQLLRNTIVRQGSTVRLISGHREIEGRWASPWRKHWAGTENPPWSPLEKGGKKICRGCLHGEGMLTWVGRCLRGEGRCLPGEAAYPGCAARPRAKLCDPFGVRRGVSTPARIAGKRPRRVRRNRLPYPALPSASHPPHRFDVLTS